LNPKQAEGSAWPCTRRTPIPARRRSFREYRGPPGNHFFSDLFGALPDPDIAVVELPDGTLREFSRPGVVMLGHRVWDPKVQRSHAEPPGGGPVVGKRGAAGLHRGCLDQRWTGRAIRGAYAEQNFGKEAGLRAIERICGGRADVRGFGPGGTVGAAGAVLRGVPLRGDEQGRDALSHAARAVGDVAFKSLLHAFYTTFQGKTQPMLAFEGNGIATADAATKAR